MEIILGVLIFIVVAVAVCLAIYPLYGWILTQLWAWFVVPFGFPQLSLTQAIGIILVVSFLTGHTGSNREKPKEEKKKDLIAFLARPFLYLGIGYIVHLFI
jgi:hypothetical protein